MICSNCYCEPCMCTNRHTTISNGTTGCCPLCEQANRKIEKAIEILKDNTKMYDYIIKRALEVLEGKV